MMTAVFPALLRELQAGRDSLLAAIVSDEGSSPRETGSMMLVGGSGRIAGTIGGGAVENLAEEEARRLLSARRSGVHEYRLRQNSGEDIGMVCGGSVVVFFQYFPAGAPSGQLAEEVLRRLEAGQPGYLLLKEEGAALLEGENPPPKSAAPGAFWAIPLPVEKRALLFGGGHIALELAPLLKRVGFRVTVFDDRPEFSDPARFPMADRTICGDYEDIGAHLTLGPEDYVVVITEGHRHDFAVERQALGHPLAYIGAIGSRTKTAAVNQRLLDCGFTETDLRRLHAPIGIPIQSATPAEIAVSIAGEMILVRAERRKRETETPCPMA